MHIDQITRQEPERPRFESPLCQEHKKSLAGSGQTEVRHPALTVDKQMLMESLIAEPLGVASSVDGTAVMSY